jgi:4-amino-4-deoxy-L-arabinose transferase-like glycosyltransferase
MPINQNVSVIVLGDRGPVDHPVLRTEPVDGSAVVQSTVSIAKRKMATRRVSKAAQNVLANAAGFQKTQSNRERLRRTLGQLSDNHWQTEVLLVGKPGSSDGSSLLTDPGVSTAQFQNLGEALAATRHGLIAIVDENCEFGAAHWKFMAERSQRSPIQTSFCLPRSPKSYLRGLLWIYSLVVRLLLRTGKTELHSGLTFIDRAELEPLLSNFDRCEVSGGDSSGPFAVTRLLALARLNGHRIAETNLDESSTGIHNDPGLMRIGRAFGNTLKFWWNQIMFPRHESEFSDREPKSATMIAGTAILLLIAGCMMFKNLDFPLFEPDEARNAQLALNIIESGQWMSLSLEGEYYWDKPPFQMWAVAASYKLFGVSQIATRLPVAVAAMLTLLLTLLVGKRLVGFQAAWLGTFLLLLTSAFVLAGRYLTMDSSLTAMVTAMFLFGFLAIKDGFHKRHALVAGIACGLGILIKGPVIGVLCLPPLLAAIWLSPAQQKIPIRSCLWFAVPAFLIAAPWFIATAFIHPDFLTYFFWKHHVLRFSNAFNHREPFWYYFVGIFVFMFPASYLIPSVTKFLTSRKPENRLLRTRETGFLFLSVVWIIGFFSLAESKLPTYILPAFPLICLLMGTLLDRKIFNQTNLSMSSPNSLAPDAVQPTRRTFLDRLSFHAPASIGLWTMIVGSAVFFYLRSEFASVPAAIAGILVVASVAAVGITQRSNPKIAWTCYGLNGLIMVSLLSHTLIPAVSNYRSIYVAAEEIQSTDEFAGAPIVFFGRETRGSGLILDPQDVFYFEASETISMVEFLTDHPNAIIVSSDDSMKALRRNLPWTILLEEREDSRHLYLSRLNQAVIARQPASNQLQR